MKQLKSLFLLAGLLTASAMFIISCDDNGSETGFQNEADVQNEVAAEAFFEDVDDFSNSVANLPDNLLSGRYAGIDDRICDEAEVEWLREDSSNPDTVAIDFGSVGCTDPKGNVRKGKMNLIYTGDRKTGLTVVFVDFYLNAVKLEGTRTVSRVGTNPATFTFTLTGGKVTWPDGTFATRESSGTRVFVRSLLNPSLDSMILKSGSSASGVSRKGNAYSMTVTQDILFKRACMEAKIFVPVSGVKTINVGTKVVTVDFGDGTCDKLATVTINGVSKEVTLDRN